eukprot:g3301.t1
MHGSIIGDASILGKIIIDGAKGTIDLHAYNSMAQASTIINLPNSEKLVLHILRGSRGDLLRVTFTAASEAKVGRTYNFFRGNQEFLLIGYSETPEESMGCDFVKIEERGLQAKTLTVTQLGRRFQKNICEELLKPLQPYFYAGGAPATQRMDIDAERMANLFDDGNEHFRTRIAALEQQIESEQLSKELLLTELDRLRNNSVQVTRQSKLHEENIFLQRQLADIKNHHRAESSRYQDDLNEHKKEISRLNRVNVELEAKFRNVGGNEPPPTTTNEAIVSQTEERGAKSLKLELHETRQRLQQMTKHYHTVRGELSKCMKDLEDTRRFAADAAQNARRQTVRYVVREPTNGSTEVHLDKIVRTSTSNSENMKTQPHIFKSREQAMARSQLAVITSSYEKLKEAHASLFTAHQKLTEEKMHLEQSEKKMRQKFDTMRMNTAFQLAAQKNALTRQKLLQNLYKSRQIAEAPQLNGLIRSSSAATLMSSPERGKGEGSKRRTSRNGTNERQNSPLRKVPTGIDVARFPAVQSSLNLEASRKARSHKGKKLNDLLSAKALG